MRPLIIYVDDEPRLVDSYIRELKFDYEVKLIISIDELFVFLENKSNNVRLIILDVMMPYGSDSNLDCANNGLRTGLLAYEKIRKNNPKLPIIIFTNKAKDKNDEIVKKITQDTKAMFLQKEDYLPFQLAEEIQNFL